MSSAFENGTVDVQLMAEYDFKSPINATVLICDDDEDSSTEINPIHENANEFIGSPSNTCKNPLSGSKTVQLDEKKTNENEVQNNSESRYQCQTKELSMNHNNNMANPAYDKTILREDQCSNSNQIATNTLQSLLESCLDSKSLTPVDEKKTNENEVQNNTESRYQHNKSQAKELLMNHNNNMANPAYDKTISREDQCSNSNQIATSTSKGLLLGSFRDGNSLTPVTSNQDAINKRANECVQTLLNIVSDHLIFIMKAYFDYKTFTRTKTDKAVVESATKQFQKTKHKWFYMSFSAVSNIMLPKENDKAFMQNFIDNTVQIAHSKHLYLRHVDMAMVCKEMFSWVKTYSQKPTLVGLLTKEPQNTEITSNRNNRDLVGCDKPNNTSDSTHCIFTSGPRGREVTINVSSTDIHKSHNVPSVPLRQGTQPDSDESKTNNIIARNFASHYSVQNAPAMQNVLTFDNDLRTNVNSTDFTRHCTGQSTASMQSVQEFSNELRTNPNLSTGQSTASMQSVQEFSNELRTNPNLSTGQSTASMQSVQESSYELRTNPNLINSTVRGSDCFRQHAASLQSVHRPVNELWTNANSVNYLSQNTAQNMAPRQNLLQDPSDQLKINAISTNYASHGHVGHVQSHGNMQNMKIRQGAQPAREKSRADANSTNYISHDPIQNVPRQGIQPPPYGDVWRKNATTTNYIQEFEHFNNNYSYYQPVFKYKSQYQSSKVRIQRETHHHPTHTPHLSRPPPYSMPPRHHDTATLQNYSPNQVVNSTHCDDTQVMQESVEVNRSLSRDSGFMSPLTSAPQDPMLYSPSATHNQMDSSSTFTPLITHVTSLNPSVAYIKDGICHVCGKLTKDKCLGCLKIYYCSHLCQIHDWKNHIYTCSS